VREKRDVVDVSLFSKTLETPNVFLCLLSFVDLRRSSLIFVDLEFLTCVLMSLFCNSTILFSLPARKGKGERGGCNNGTRKCSDEKYRKHENEVWYWYDCLCDDGGYSLLDVGWGC